MARYAYLLMGDMARPGFATTAKDVNLREKSGEIVIQYRGGERLTLGQATNREARLHKCKI